MSDILCAFEGDLATVTINRPRQRNTMTFAMWGKVGEIFEALAADRSVRAVILTGAGADFSAGADVSEFASVRDDDAQAVTYEEAVDYGCASICRAGKPVIAVCSGYCLGGGAHLAMSCDFRFADYDAVFGIPAARLSIVYGVQATRKLLALVGLTEAKRILYSGESFGASRALTTGFVDHVSDDPMAAAREFASKLSNSAPLTIRGAKYVLDGLALGTFDAAEAGRLINQASASADYLEGRAAFAEKRTPRFAGR